MNCEVCGQAPAGHQEPKVVSELFQGALVKVRWMLSEDDGHIFGAELVFADGSRAQIRIDNGTATGISCVALRPQDFHEQAGFTLADA